MEDPPRATGPVTFRTSREKSNVIRGVLIPEGGSDATVRHERGLGLALRRTGDWWAFIPGGVLLGLTLAVFSNGAPWGGPAFLASIGGFSLIAARHPEHWWAVIPGGALLFLGLAATFLVLAGLPAARSQGGTHRWAWCPAAGLLALAVVSGGWFGGALGGVLLLVPRRGRR
ncbi:hypothetical protein [Deinococcus planocerae]|uniref:hypothetical protein n=1 Tax=Deinococcus planocerae TaxID=1737569 RepID=UPI0011AF3D55|nr:hypothetical protein [Deinococcus planocerae]